MSEGTSNLVAIVSLLAKQQADMDSLTTRYVQAEGDYYAHIESHDYEAIDTASREHTLGGWTGSQQSVMPWWRRLRVRGHDSKLPKY